jgi:arylformamidase
MRSHDHIEDGRLEDAPMMAPGGAVPHPVIGARQSVSPCSRSWQGRAPQERQIFISPCEFPPQGELRKASSPRPSWMLASKAAATTPSMKPKIFRDYDHAELDRQYDQRAWATNAVAVIERYGTASDAARKRLGEPRVFAYGDTPSETFDLYRTDRPQAPLQIFLHGGAWRLLSKRESAFAAETFVNAGAHFVAVDFAALPQVTLTDMVAQVRRAIAWIYRHATTFGGDPRRIYVSGHSSGAHLAANAIVTDWARESDLPNDLIKGAVCASGIYDLKPVRLSARSSYVVLDDAAEHALSPQRHLEQLGCPLVVAYGEFDSDEFKRQSRELAGGVGRTRQTVQLIEANGLNHFEIAETLAQADGVLGRAALTQMHLPPPRDDHRSNAR